MNFRDQSVWVTGASSGIGRALSIRLAQQGAKLVISSRSEEKLCDLASEITNLGGEVTIAPIDFSDRDSAFDESKQIVQSANRIDMLIYAAGISTRATVEEADIDIYRSVMEVNYFGMICAIKSVLPPMLQTGCGTICAISSVAGKVGSKNRSGYSGSKYAVCGFMDCLRAEVKSRGIHCITICPGYVRTNIARNALRADGEPRGESTDEIEGGMQPDHCAAQILRAISAKKDEAVISRGIGRWAPLLKRICPTLVNRFVSQRKW